LLRDTARERAMTVAEQIHTSFADATREVDGRPVGATVSIGISISNDCVVDLSALLAQADHAPYRAEDADRNRVEIASIELILNRARRGTADLLAAVGGKSAA
jgi:PleD family two-component response regulator